MLEVHPAGNRPDGATVHVGEEVVGQVFYSVDEDTQGGCSVVVVEVDQLGTCW